MVINGREVRFRYTVHAAKRLFELVPGGDFKKLEALLKKTTGESIAVIESLAEIMSEGYENARAFEAAQLGQAYEPRPLTYEEIENLDVTFLSGIAQEVFDEVLAGSKTTVEGEPPKGKKTEKAAGK